MSEFHAHSGYYFRRGADGAVSVRSPNGTVTFDASTWASIVASVCGAGETAETYAAAGEFHKTGEVTDARLARHHRECEHAGEEMAKALRAIIAAGDSDPALFGIDAPRALKAWDAHQWPDPSG